MEDETFNSKGEKEEFENRIAKRIAEEERQKLAYAKLRATNVVSESSVHVKQGKR